MSTQEKPMGLMDKLRAELIDIIEWVDDDRHTLVWRYPRYRNQIKNGAQLIVRPSQQAIFVRQGQIADVFGPGQYRLETKNLPILSTLAGWKYGFDSPFQAEVYFVNARQITDLKWGTPNPVMMRDPDFGTIRVRAFGTYTLQAQDPKILLTELVGTDSTFESDEISELLRSIVNSAFADVVAKSEIPVLDLAAHYADLGEQIRKLVVERIDDEYGLEIPQLFIVNISVPTEVEQALDVRSSMAAVGDVGHYQAYQLGSSMPIAAANPAGGLAGAGVGLGMGMAIAGSMVPGTTPGTTGPAAGPSPAPQAPPPVPPAANWHIAQAGQTLGPFSLEQMGQGVPTGQLTPNTLVWTSGMAGWVAAGQVQALLHLFAPAPPPPPQVPTS
jgi:membrane protease subunit (stomatin/prohibitin family)